MRFSWMHTGDAKNLVLIETSISAKAGEVTGVFDGTADIWKKCLDFIMLMLHHLTSPRICGLHWSLGAYCTLLQDDRR